MTLQEVAAFARMMRRLGVQELEHQGTRIVLSEHMPPPAIVPLKSKTSKTAQVAKLFAPSKKTLDERIEEDPSFEAFLTGGGL